MSRLARRSALAALFCLFSAAATAASGKSDPEALSAPGPPARAAGLDFNLDAAIRAALESNRELQAALQRVAVARGLALQAGRLPNPELELSMASDFAFAGDGERDGTLAFEQRMPVTHRLDRERDVAETEIAVAEAEAQEVARGLIGDVSRAFYAVLGLDRRLALQEQLAAFLRGPEQASARRLQAAEGSATDVSLLRIERLRLEQQVRQLGAEREGARSALARLLGLSPETPIRALGDLEAEDPLTAPTDAEDSVARRPDVRVASLAVRRAQGDAALARAERWEDWRLRLGMDWERQVFDEPIGTKRDRKLGLDVVVPIPLWNRNQGKIEAADAEAQRAQRAREGIALGAEAELRAVQGRLEALRASEAVYRTEILPESARALGMVERGYRQGLISVSDLLQAQRQNSEARVAYVELLAELRQTSVELETVTGSSPHLKNVLPGGEGS